MIIVVVVIDFTEKNDKFIKNNVSYVDILNYYYSLMMVPFTQIVCKGDSESAESDFENYDECISDTLYHACEARDILEEFVFDNQENCTNLMHDINRWGPVLMTEVPSTTAAAGGI